MGINTTDAYGKTQHVDVVLPRRAEVGDIPQYILDAALRIAPSTDAPAATPEPEKTEIAPVNRLEYPVILGWEPDYWRYDLNPTTGSVAAIPIREGTASCRWGDRAHFCGAVFGWSRGRMVLTPEGVEFVKRRAS